MCKIFGVDIGNSDSKAVSESGAFCLKNIISPGRERRLFEEEKGAYADYLDVSIESRGNALGRFFVGDLALREVGQYTREKHMGSMKAGNGDTYVLLLTSVALSAVYPCGDYDPFYFAIVLENHYMYSYDQYEIRTHIDNYQFNTVEYPLAGKWYTGKVDNWMPVYPELGEYYTLPREYYSTRADNIKIFDGMQVKYTVSLKQLSTGTIKDYKGTVTIKLN